MNTEKLLECVQLTKQYGIKHAVDHMDFVLEPGHITGLLGPNGSGKTTLIKMAAGLLKPTGGEIRILGEAPGVRSCSLVSYLPDRVYLPKTATAASLIEYYLDFYEDFDAARADRMIRDLGIDPDQQIRALSKGTVEKVQLILCMSRRASLYLLDEPIAGVDPAARDYIIRTIIGNYNPGSSVLISTHLIQDVENILTDIVFIRNGQVILHDTKEGVREHTGKTVDQYFREVFACWGC